MFVECESLVSVKRHGEVKEDAFNIVECENSLLMVLDHTKSVTIDDCKACLIVIGPCSGSVFIRDCSKCTILASCQQFRASQSSLNVSLFCPTEPVVEESNIEFSPLSIDYPHYKEQLEAAGLLGKQNLWSKVNDFTPDSSELKFNTELKPIDKVYAPKCDWVKELARENVQINQPVRSVAKLPNIRLGIIGLAAIGVGIGLAYTLVKRQRSSN